MERGRFSFEGLARPAMLIFLASVIGAFLSYLFQSYMGNELGPSKFSELSSLLSIFYLLSIPSTIIGTTILYYISKLKAEHKDDEIAWLMRSDLKLCVIVGLIMALVMLLISPLILDFLDISDDLVMVMIALSAFLLMLGTPVNSTVQGLQRFTYLATYNVLGPLLKLVLGILFVLLGWSVLGGFGAAMAGTVLAFIVLYYCLRDYWKKEGKEFDNKSMLAYSIPVAFSTISFVTITNIDNLLARGFLDSTDAGLYSACSMLGKIVLWLPLSISTVTFPKFTGAKAKGDSTSSLIHKSVLITLAITGVITLFCWAFPRFVLNFVYGDEFLDAAEILPVVILAFSLFGLATMFQRYGLATWKWTLIEIYVIFTVIGIGLISVFHGSPMEIALDMLACSAGISIFSAVYLELKLNEEKKAKAPKSENGAE